MLIKFCVIFCFLISGIMPHCIDPGTIEKVTVLKYDGQNWEDSMKANLHGIQSRSTDDS